VAVIGKFRSDLSITRKTDGNFGNVSAVFYFPKSHINENSGNSHLFRHGSQERKKLQTQNNNLNPGGH